MEIIDIEETIKKTNEYIKELEDELKNNNEKINQINLEILEFEEERKIMENWINQENN